MAKATRKLIPTVRRPTMTASSTSICPYEVVSNVKACELQICIATTPEDDSRLLVSPKVVVVPAMEFSRVPIFRVDVRRGASGFSTQIRPVLTEN
jgi:hypothetical protein